MTPLGRSLSAGRKMLASVLGTGNKDQSSSSIADSLKHHQMSARDDKMMEKASLFTSKLNFLNYDKQPQGSYSQLYSSKGREKGQQLDLSIYQKILCGRSKAITPSNFLRKLSSAVSSEEKLP